MKKGRIIKNISNQYELVADNGERVNAIPMGKLRKGLTPLVGDIVDYEKIDDIYAIQSIDERKNALARPAIANVDQAVIVMSALEPDFSTTLIDRLIFMISYADIKPILCVTKMDLLYDRHDIDKYIDDYRKSGYEVYTSGKDFNTDDIENVLKDKITVLTGQSGVGKSTLINRIDDQVEIKTQGISKALGRGKHTTRHCELFAINGGWVGDTPGFSSLTFDGMDMERLAESIIDFKPYIGQCRFNDCTHINEPDCAIKKAVEEGRICSYRYEHYRDIAIYIRNLKPRY